MKQYTQKEFDRFPVNDCGYKQCPSGDYTLITNFPNRCSFDDLCYFGTGCSFGKQCSFDGLCYFGTGCSFGEQCSFGERYD